MNGGGDGLSPGGRPLRYLGGRGKAPVSRNPEEQAHPGADVSASGQIPNAPPPEAENAVGGVADSTDQSNERELISGINAAAVSQVRDDSLHINDGAGGPNEPGSSGSTVQIVVAPNVTTQPAKPGVVTRSMAKANEIPPPPSHIPPPVVPVPDQAQEEANEVASLVATDDSLNPRFRVPRQRGGMPPPIVRAGGLPPAPINAGPLRDRPVYWQDGKVGDHSVYPTQFEVLQFVRASSMTQDIVTGVNSLLQSLQENVIIGDNLVRLSGQVSIPNWDGAATISEHTYDYRREHNAIPPPQINICWGDPRPNGEVSMASKNTYIRDNNIDARVVTGFVKGQTNCSNEMAGFLVTSLNQNFCSYDLTSLFTLLFFLVDYRFWIDRGNYRVNPGAAPGDCVTYVDMGATGVPAAAQIVTATTAINATRLGLSKDVTSAGVINVMRAISLGSNAFVLPDDQNLIHRRFQWPRIDWVIWGLGPFPLPQQAAPTIADLLAAASIFANEFDAWNDYVTGYTRAQLLVNLHLAENEEMFLSTLEVRSLSMLRPRGRHWVWSALHGVYDRTEDRRLLQNEATTISALSNADLIRVGAAVAGIYVTATSSLFDELNIGGRELTAWADRTANRAVVGFLNDQWFVNVLAMRCTNWALTVCGTIPQFSGYTVSILSVLTPSFSLNIHDPARAARFWNAEWARHIPYFFRPEAISWVILRWLSPWCLTGTGPRYDMNNEMFNVGDAATQGLMLWMGDSNYQTALMSNAPYLKNPYAGYLLNVYRMNQAIDTLWRISFRRIRRSAGNKVLVEPDYHEEDDIQPRYDAATFTVIPGTLLSFDWEEQCVLAPTVLRDALPDVNQWNQMWAQRSVDNTRAGYVVNNPRPVVGQLRFGYDIDVLFRGAMNLAPALAGAQGGNVAEEN